jgi:hypothetical protein
LSDRWDTVRTLEFHECRLRERTEVAGGGNREISVAVEDALQRADLGTAGAV